MKIIRLLKTPARNFEQRILKIFLIVVLPVMAILTIIAVVDYRDSKHEIISKMILDQSSYANKRIAFFIDPIIKDISFLKDSGDQGKLDPERPSEAQETLDRFSKFYLQDVKQVLIYDGSEVSFYPLNTKDTKVPYRQSGPLYELDKRLVEKDQESRIRWVSGEYDEVEGKSTLLAETIFSNPETKKFYALALQIESTQFFEGLKKYMTHPQRLVLLRNTLDQSRTFLFEFARNGTPMIREIFQEDFPEIEIAVSLFKNDESKEVVNFSIEGKTWWASIKQLDDKNSESYSAVLVPESAILMSLWKGKLTLPVYSAMVTVVAILATFFLWRRYEIELKLSSLPPMLTEMDNQTLLEAIDAGENDHLEFKSTLRWNIKANQPGKEIELAAMKTLVAFMNSAGGTLIVGVEDNGNILGTDLDNFPNEDKLLLHFNNLIKQHIGLAFAKFITFKAFTIEGKTMIVADCRKADAPVYLRKKPGEEEFYIRVGPGSRGLSLSETVSFIKSKELS